MNRDNFIPSRLRVQSIGVGFPAPLTNGDAKVVNITVTGTATVGTVNPSNVVITPTVGQSLIANSVGGGVNVRFRRDPTNVIDFYHGGGTQHIDASQAGSTLSLDTIGSQRIVIGPSGNVSIAAASTGHTLTANVSAPGAVAFHAVGSGLNPTIVLSQALNSTSYASMRLYNDANTSGRALEIDYSGTAYPTNLIGNSPSGECAAIATTSTFPLAIGTNNTARLVIGGSNGRVDYYADGGNVGQEIGFRHMPLGATFTASNGVAQSDNGKGLAYSGVGGHSMTLPALEVGTIITLVNVGTGTISIAATSSLYWFNGTEYVNAARTLAVGGVCTLWHRGGGSWWIWGMGIS